MNILFKQIRRKWRGWRKKRDAAYAKRQWESHRSHALFRASNGERLTARERREYDLPDWTG